MAQETRGSIPGGVIPKTQKKMILDAPLLNTQHDKVGIKGRGAIWGKRVAPSLHLSVVAHEKRAFGSPSTTLFTNPSAQTGYDTRSIFKRSLTGLNS